MSLFKKGLLVFILVFILLLAINSIHAVNSTAEDSYSNLTDQISTLDDKATLNLTSNYKYSDNSDKDYINGVKITKNITIKGNDAYIDGNGKARGLLIRNYCNVVIENITFQNCYNKTTDKNEVGGGSAIFLGFNSNLTLKNCVFKSNKVYNTNGGAVLCQKSTNTNIYNCKFLDNTAERVSNLEWKDFKKGMGSALCVGLNSKINIYDSIFRNNNAYMSTVLVISQGEGIWKMSTLIMRNCLFERNTAKSNVGVYMDELGQAKIYDTIFKKNKATESGGTLIFDASKSSVVKNCLFEANSGVKGGAISINDYQGNPTTVSIIDCTFSKNSAKGYGGAIFANSAIMTISNCNFNSNTAKDKGGAICTKAGTLKISKSAFNKNSAVQGGAVFLNNNKIIVDNTKFIENTASQKGGAIFSKVVKVSVSNCKYSNNKAVNGKNVYGIYNIKLTKISTYFGYVVLKIKITSPWKAPVKQKLKFRFTASKFKKVRYANTNSKGILKFRVPLDLKVGKYTMKCAPGEGLFNKDTFKIKVVRAPAKVVAKKVTAKLNSGKKFKIKVKNTKNKKPIPGAMLKLKIYTGSSHETFKVTTDQKGLVKFSTSKLSAGKHYVEISSANKNIKLSKKVTSMIKIK